MGMLRVPGGRIALALVLAVVVLLLGGGALAQSAADKATARQLGTEGVQLYRAGKYAEALDKMQRAQKLYDAPVHLIYIARSQAKLGQLVEASETYRRLIRTELPDNAPTPFKDAVADAEKELPQLEPTIPTLRIDVEPADAQDLVLAIDGVEVSSAVVGVDRPTNPGTRTVTGYARGYKQSEVSVTLAAGEKKSVTLVLEPGESPAGAGGAGGSGGTTGVGAAGEGGTGGAGEESFAKKIGFTVGGRLSALVPAGNAYKDASGDIPISELYGPGGGFELYAGARVLRKLGAHLFLAINNVQSGPEFDDAVPPVPVTNDALPSEITNQTFLTQFGAGVSFGAVPGKTGVFGQADFVFVQNFATSQEIDVDGGATKCKQTDTLTGNAVRIGGGVRVPLTQQLHLTPTALITFGRLPTRKVEGDCPPLNEDWSNPTSGTATRSYEEDIEPSNHVLLQAGVGFEYLFGWDNPSK